MECIIAEKPDVCKSIALAIGATNKQNGYWEGNGYYVSYAFGHLYTLADTKDYNPAMEYWNMNDYPFVPKEFMCKAINTPSTLKQIKILKELINKSDVIINGCDQDREGSVIFFLIRTELKINKPMKRLRMKANTPKAILDGMENLTDLPFNQELAGFCRQKVDWLLGINSTVVFSLLVGQTVKLGRIVLPTLKLIFDREIAISTFKSEPFYSLKSRFKSGNEFYVGTYYDHEHNTKFSDKLQLINIQESIKSKPGTITKKEGKKTTENSPKLFNLTDLQGHITSKFKGFTSDKVLEIMQSLYEKKHLTYPRTASRYLDDTQTKDAQESLNAIINLPELNIKNKSDVKFHTGKEVFDSSKVDSHPAIIPTYVVPDINTLSDDEKIVYLEVIKRFVSKFLPAAGYDTVEIITKVEEYSFITKGKVLVEEGWKQLYINQLDTEEDQEENNQEEDPEESITAKNIKPGDIVAVAASEIKNGKTNPPAHYTEKTLLIVMETCGKNVENEEELLKGYMIGTPATRGSTIKKLFECGYISSKGKNLLITDLGAKVIHFFPVKRLLKTDFTGQIEKTLKDIENGQYDSKEFMDKMTAYIVKSIEELKKCEIPQILKSIPPSSIVGICPKCGKNVVENEKAYSCEATRNSECNFTLWKEDKFWLTFSKKLTTTIAKDLIKNKKATVKGLKNTKKEGDPFDAVVSIVEEIVIVDNIETGYWNYKLSFDNDPKKKSNSKFKSKTPHTTKFKKD